jgi:glycosyltransferase involved in cell wall biosynthesis
MKIVIDSRLYGLENAGLGRYVMNLVRNLQAKDKSNEYVLILRKRYFDELKLPKNWSKVLFDHRHYSFNEQLLLPKVLRDLKPDLVHFPHFNVPVFYSGPFVVTIHDILMHKQKGLEATTLPAPMYFIKRFGYHRVFSYAINNSKKIIVPSNYIKSEIKNYYKLEEDKIVVTYEGFDEKITNVSSPESILKKYEVRKPYFIYTGNAYPHKNLERLVEAVVNLNKTKKDKAVLAIVSSRGVFLEKLERLINKYKAMGYIKLLGFVPDEDLGVLLSSSSAFTFPSLSEGFGLPGLEAISSGTLLLVSDIPVFKEIFKDSAIYFNPFDYSSIEESLKSVLNMSDEVRKEKIQKARKFANRYSWDKMAKETLNVYKSCLGLRPGK